MSITTKPSQSADSAWPDSVEILRTSNGFIVFPNGRRFELRDVVMSPNVLCFESTDSLMARGCDVVRSHEVTA